MSDEVKKFVRETLGCQCPEEVFEKIEVDSKVKMADYIVEKRINVGNRLLIYVVDGDTLKEEDLKRLIAIGKEERDNRGFNRFRLVVISEGGINLEGIQEFVKDHERAHLHVIGKNLVHF